MCESFSADQYVVHVDKGEGGPKNIKILRTSYKYGSYSPSASPPMETFSGIPATVEEVEFHCLTSYGDTCALNYIEFA